MKAFFAMAAGTLTLLGGAAATPAIAKNVRQWPALGVETAILFPGRTVRDFEVDETRGFWLQDRQMRWYYGRFRSPCQSLQYSRMKGLNNQGRIRFDRTSVLWINGERCALEHFVTAAAPPRRAVKKDKTQPVAANKDQNP